MQIDFDIERVDADRIKAILDRTEMMGITKHGDRRVHAMDLTACHLNGCPLKLGAMVDGDIASVAHDIFGINQHLDRTTGQIDDAKFSPRFSA